MWLCVGKHKALPSINKLLTAADLGKICKRGKAFEAKNERVCKKHLASLTLHVEYDIETLASTSTMQSFKKFCTKTSNYVEYFYFFSFILLY